MNWQTLLTKNAQNIFLLINQMKDLTWKKSDLAKRMDVDVKTIDRYLKRLKSEDYPLELAYDKKKSNWFIIKHTMSHFFCLNF